METTLHNLKPTTGSRKDIKRLGRGISSGKGKTAGKGTKGQNARTGGGTRPGFEGGQTPLYRRVSKRGFTNFTTTNYSIVNLEQINLIETTDITPEVLFALKLIRNKKDGIKVLAKGKLTSAKTIKAHKFSKSAVAAIEQVGGKAEVI
ncbi:MULTISPECIES: 50S ribosomal protein L15 [unclassified Spiroplasma]|uniref:50S ribosomal protein L15 n=1 Tax=unclassified Spiroplasma TaxID=2637901 RepID=UPI0027E08A41|nr:50S ribosomal protein L15 [Spiroplasma sp. AdecLV25b]